MLRIVYISTASAEADAQEIGAILSVAEQFNRKMGITGILLYNGFNFMQALEGPREAVDTLYGRIRRDARHSGVKTLLEEYIERQSYPDWGMKLTNVSAEDVPEIANLDAKADALLSVSPQKVREMLVSLLKLC